MDYINEGAEAARSTYNAVLDAAGAVFRALTSKTAQRTLLTTVLFSLVSAFLFAVACLGYLAFYHEYLPDQVTTVPVHLQYGYELNPYGVVPLAHDKFKDYQEYDISVTLNLPRSPANLDRGNFMLALHLLDDAAPGTSTRVSAHPGVPTTVAGPSAVLDGRNVLYTSTRPAIVPYSDPLVSLAARLLFLLYHVFVPASETTKLEVPMVERLEFRPGHMMPTTLVLDVQAGQTLQVYSAFVTVTAQLHGLRWFMHSWRLTSFVLFTCLFWACEVSCLLMTMLSLKLLFGGGGGGGSGLKSQTIKKEQANPHHKAIKHEVEDVPMTFPTAHGQPPLRYDPEPAHTNGVSSATPQADMPPAAGGEADDEDDEDGGEMVDMPGEPDFHDSGIGTSYSEREGPGSVRQRRTSRGRLGALYGRE